MRDNVFVPLEMNDTSSPVDGWRIIPNRANAYAMGVDGDLIRYLTEDFNIPGPAHAFSSIDDMALWLDNLRTGRVGGSDLVHEMMQPTMLSNGSESFYGAGLGTGEYRGVRTIGHAGQTGGFKSELLYCPELEVGVVVLGNTREMQASSLARRVLDAYLADELEPLPQANTAVEAAEDAAAPEDDAEPFTMEPLEYQPYLGGYRLEDDPSVVVGVAREGGRLVMVLLGEGMDFFSPVGPDEFENGIGNCRIRFFDDQGDSIAERVEITLRGEKMPAVRIPYPADSGWLDDLPGRYYCDEVPLLYDIVREEQGLTVRHLRSPDRLLEPIDRDVLVGGIGVLTVLRNEAGRVTGFDFSEPEDFGARLFRFTKYEPSS